MSQQALILIIGVLLQLLTAALTFIAARHYYIRAGVAKEALGLATLTQELLARVDALDQQLVLVNQSVVPINQAYQSVLIKELTHYHTPVLDALMVKLGPPYSLTPEEEIQLLQLLEQREVDMGDLISEAEREAAHILPVVIKRVRAEHSIQEQKRTALQVVTVTIPEEESGTAT